MINNERLIRTFLEYVQISSESKNEKAVSEKITADLDSLGLSTYADESGKKIGSNGNNIYCILPGSKDIEPMLFSAHMDTVKPGMDIKPYIEDGYIKSKGDTVLGSDDKAGICAILEALRIVKESKIPHGTIEAVFTICEEEGLLGAKNIDYSRLKSKKAVVIDCSGTSGKIVTQAPGQIKLFSRIIGKPSHAGLAPENGISAIMVAAEAIANMKLLRIDHETTANIGTLKAEGATNIVSPQAQLVAEARSLSLEKLQIQVNHMVSCLQNAVKKYGADVEINTETSYYPFKINQEDEYVLLIKEKCRELGIEVKIASSGGGSDANIYNQNGILAVNIGVGMELVHTADERLNIQEFEKTANLVAALMLR